MTDKNKTNTPGDHAAPRRHLSLRLNRRPSRATPISVPRTRMTTATILIAIVAPSASPSSKPTPGVK